eukprot:135926-Pleurochrysis_carterae.AAC.1
MASRCCGPTLFDCRARCSRVRLRHERVTHAEDARGANDGARGAGVRERCESTRDRDLPRDAGCFSPIRVG